jgi:energy-coupling factor transporter ATP-binding protein EcfA2
MSIERELLQFSRGRPAWQQDLIRRICTRPNTYRSVMDEVLSNLKASQGLGEPKESEPLHEKHLSQRGSTTHVGVALAAISNVRDANQLAANQELSFALKGITLVYGNNGSGKTGYTRIVKQLCRARRDKLEPLLGNVYKGSTGPAKADVTYLLGDKQLQFHWQDGKPVPPELSQISVFDASTVPLYADHQNEIEFLPWGLDILPHLGRACQQLTQQLQGEIDALEEAFAAALPQQIPGAPAESLTRLLVSNTPEANLPSELDLRQAGRWSGDDDKRLKEIERELQQLSEPARAAAQCRRFKASLDGFRQRLNPVEQLFQPDAIAKYREEFARTRAAREAATIAAQRRFDQDPLGAIVGSEAWRKLYEYAEKLSALAYPGEDFPVTEDDRVCLLCQQPLEEQAADRMKRFRELMQDTCEKHAQTQEARLNGFLQSVQKVSIPTTEETQLQFLDLSAAEPPFVTIGAQLSQFVAEALVLKKKVTEALSGQAPFEDLASLKQTTLQAASNYSDNLKAKAEAFDRATADSVATNRLRTEQTELLGRQRLHGALPTVLSRRAALIKFHKLNRCKDECDTYQISRKNTEFRETYLTVEFEMAVKKEIVLLGLSYLPTKVDAKTEKGTSYIGIGLNKHGNARNASILSEGEFRALALACFFAEIATIPDHDGIVVDDPVSSLDHRHMKQVARRLVEEANTRPQVIVFTHDISFYYELWFAASEADIPVHRNWIQHTAVHGFGTVIKDDGPWQVKNTKERIKVLDGILMRMPEGGLTQEDRAKHVQDFYARLRESWERLVEERLLGSVSARFQPGVMTQSLKNVTVTDEDYRLVFFNMKKVSEFTGHDWAVAREGTLPDKLEMMKDLAILKRYDEVLKKRTDETASRRRKLEEPTRADISPSTN